jgi:hypothetical protein
MSDQGASVQGIAIDLHKEPVAQAQVVLVPADPKLRHYTRIKLDTAGHKGNFHLQGVRPGEYLLFAVTDNPQEAFLEERFFQTHSDQIQKIKLGPAEKKTFDVQVIGAEEDQ